MDEKDEVLENLRLLKEHLAKKTEPANMGAPERILIGHDDYHAEHIGRTRDGLQFFVTGLFIPAQSPGTGNEFIAVFLFNSDGDLVESRVDELGPRYSFKIEDARDLKAKRLSELGEIVYQNIEIKPFAVEHKGVMMGFIPSWYEGRWAVELLPGNFMAFHEPWDSGIYDT